MLFDVLACAPQAYTDSGAEKDPAAPMNKIADEVFAMKLTENFLQVLVTFKLGDMKSAT